MVSVRDGDLMGEALNEARKALAEGELPVGAILVEGDRVVARARAADRRSGNRVSHAELRLLAGTRLVACQRGSLTIYTTLEPCVMCAAAILIEGVGRVVYGLPAPVDGGLALFEYSLLVQRCGGRVPPVTGGVRRGDCQRLMEEFAVLPGAPTGMVEFARAILSGDQTT